MLLHASIFRGLKVHRVRTYFFPHPDCVLPNPVNKPNEAITGRGPWQAQSTGARIDGGLCASIPPPASVACPRSAQRLPSLGPIWARETPRWGWGQASFGGCAWLLGAGVGLNLATLQGHQGSVRASFGRMLGPWGVGKSLNWGICQGIAGVGHWRPLVIFLRFSRWPETFGVR